MAGRSDQSKPILMNKLIDIERYGQQAISFGAQVIRSGGIIALPTDTVYGLATIAQSPTAIVKLYTVKGRAFRKPIAICLHHVNDVCNWGKVSHLPFGILNALLPGPVTVVLQRTTNLNKSLNPSESNIAIRVPNNGFVCEIVNHLKEPIALTSANESGAPSSLEPIEFVNLWPKLDAIFDGNRIGCSADARLGSTIVDLTVKNCYRVIRPGSALFNTIYVLHKFGFKELKNNDEQSIAKYR